MPRLLPADWIWMVAINCLLQLYEQEANFVQEWEDVRKPFIIPLIEQFAKVNTINEVEYLIRHNPPDDLISWVSDLQKLRNYLRGPQINIERAQSPLEIPTNYNDLLERLTPYVSSLSKLAYDWNLRAPWAGEELMWRDVQRVQQRTFDVAGITTLNKFSDRQIQKLLGDKGPLSEHIRPIYPSTLSLYLSGGRVGYLKMLNRRLKEFERKLKASGAKEPPSALDKHAEWWFDHYVHDTKFPEIANKTIGPNNETGRYPENIRKAVIKFSELLGIDPIEGT